MKKILIFYLVIAILFLFKSFKENDQLKERPLFEAVFLNAGQGDSILMQAPDSYFQVLVDAGDGEALVIEDKIEQYLPLGDNMIDIIILTHPHQDHYGGLEYVLQEFDVGLFVYNGVNSEDSEFKKTLDSVRLKEIPILKSIRGQKISVDDDFELEILHPYYSFDLEYKNLNNSSLVIDAKISGKRFLLMGDLEIKGERVLLNYLAQKKDYKYDFDLIKIGHHGSDTATSQELLEEITVKNAVISVALNNKFNHPGREVINRLKINEINPYYTYNGDIIVRNGEIIQRE